MAWFSGKVSLGNFPDLAGAVNKFSESVKNIEKNFDSAFGFEDKAGATTSTTEVIMSGELQDENVLVQQLQDQEEISRHMPLPSHPSATSDISVHGATPNDVLSATEFKPVKKNNHFVDFDHMRMNEVIKAILRGHPIAYSLTKTVDVPEVYVQQVWHNIVKVHRARPPYFHITVDRFETRLTYRRLRTIIQFPGPQDREGKDSYDPFPTDDEVLQGILAMGYDAELRQSSDFHKVYLPTHWYDLFSMLNRCLTSKATGVDHATMCMLKLFYCIIHDLHVDYTWAIWNDLTEVVNDKFNKRNRTFVPFYRFLQLIVQSVIDSTDDFPNRADWPRAQHHQCKYFQKQDHHFTNSLNWMLIPRSLVERYADPSDPAVVEFIFESDEFEAMMAEEVQTAPLRERHTKRRQEVREVVHEDDRQEQEDPVMEEMHEERPDIATTSQVHESVHVEEVLEEEQSQDNPVLHSTEHHMADHQTDETDWNEGVIGDDTDWNEDDDDLDDDNDDSNVGGNAIVLVPSSSEPPSTFTVNLPPSSGLSSMVLERPLQRMDMFSLVTSSLALSTVTASVSISAPLHMSTTSTFARTSSTAAPIYASIPVSSAPASSATPVATASTSAGPSRGLEDFSTSDIVEHLQGRLLSMAPANQQSADLLSLLRSLKSSSAQPAASSSYSARDDIAALRTEVRELKENTDLQFAKLESMLLEIGKHLQVPSLSCSAQASPTSKRPHDQDDDSHRDHEGEKRRRVEQGETETRRETDQASKNVVLTLKIKLQETDQTKEALTLKIKLQDIYRKCSLVP